MQVEPRALEGATPLDDCSGLKLSWVYDHSQLDAVEADNIRLAMNKYLRKKRYPFPGWFKTSHINKVHKEMFGKVWTWAGKFRKSVKSIGVAPYKIPVEMAHLEADMAFWALENSFSPLEIAARVHHRLVWIHPYENGNGRHGRFIGDMVFLTLGQEKVMWPGLAENGQERRLYIQALKDADVGDFIALIEFMKRYKFSD